MRFTSSLFLLPMLVLADSASNLTFHSDVDMVTLAFRVERSSKYVTDLAPEKITILENGREQKIESFNHPEAKIVAQTGKPESIFLLIDTSNAMYSGFAHARDAIAQFVRSLDPAHAVAVYTFSRNLYRASPLTTDRQVTLASLTPSSGDDTALYNAMLLTLRDAAKVPGPKKLVVFSNGSDVASQVSPDDVSRVAEDLGIPIYVVSTSRNDEVSNAVWSRITSRTGGSLHLAANWRQQRSAFQHISDDIRNTYTVTYYSNTMAPGFRKVQVQVRDGKYSVICRPGYYAPEKPQTLASRTVTSQQN